MKEHYNGNRVESFKIKKRKQVLIFIAIENMNHYNFLGS